MQPIPPSTPSNRQLTRVSLLGGLIAASITMGFALITGDVQKVGSDGETVGEKDARSETLADRSSTAMLEARVRRARFFESTVVPLIEQVDRQNDRAAERCIGRVESVIARYHTGVDPFVSDMTSLKTRLGILRRMPADWWKSDGRIEAYVQGKFETHLFSESQLVDDITAALTGFRRDVQSNQVRMLTQVQAALTTADLPGVQLEAQNDFFHELSSRVGSFAAGQGTHSVENMLGAFVLGEVGGFAARSIIAGLLARFAPTVAIGSAAGASATLGASATGAGGGSLGGPIGTAVGFGAGLVIGLIIDWWMTDKFESKLRGQLHVYLDDLSAALLSANLDDADNAEAETALTASGLNRVLPSICDQLRAAYQDQFFQIIVHGETL